MKRVQFEQKQKPVKNWPRPRNRIVAGKLFCSLVFFLAFLLSTLLCQAGEETSQEEAGIVKSVLNLIIHQSALTQYFHPELEERTPIKIATNGLIAADVSLGAFGSPILFYSSANSRNFINIRKFQINENLVTFSLSYKVEGVFVEGVAVFADGVWKVKEMHLVEHNDT